MLSLRLAVTVIDMKLLFSGSLLLLQRQLRRSVASTESLAKECESLLKDMPAVPTDVGAYVSFLGNSVEVDAVVASRRCVLRYKVSCAGKDQTDDFVKLAQGVEAHGASFGQFSAEAAEKLLSVLTVDAKSTMSKEERDAFQKVILDAGAGASPLKGAWKLGPCFEVSAWRQVKENVVSAASLLMFEAAGMAAKVATVEASVTPESFQDATIAIVQMQNNKAAVALAQAVREDTGCDGWNLTCLTTQKREALQDWCVCLCVCACVCVCARVCMCVCCVCVVVCG